MKAKIWLSMPKDRNHWHYGLARYADGSIRVSEILFCDGFTTVGMDSRRHVDSKFNKGLPLSPGERKLIVKDLYIACCLELGTRPDYTVLKARGADKEGDQA